MKKPISTTLAAILLIAPIGSIATAQESTSKPETREAALPTPKEVVDRMIEFTGGVKAYQDPKPTKTTGSFTIPQAQLTGSMTTWSAPPNLMRVDIEIPGLGTTMNGFDGKIGWTMDPTRGPSIMDGAMLEEIKREANSNAMLDLLKDYPDAKVTGRETFEGVECVVLRLEKGKVLKEQLVEEKTGRLVGTRSKMPTPMGEIPSTTVIEKWMTIGPRKVAAKTVIKMMGMDQVMQIDKVMTDEPINPEVFALPPAIKALAEARDSKKKTSSDSDFDSDFDSDSDSSSSSSSDSSSSKDSSSSSSKKSSSSSSSDSSSSKDSSSSSSKKSSGSKNSSRKSSSSSSSSSSGGGR